MSIPLVRNNTKDAINTSIIAIKKNLERINSILGLADSSEPDLSGLATKQELEDTVTEINNTIDEVETSLQPVDTVTSGDMHSVTSNAVYNYLPFRIRSFQKKRVTISSINSHGYVIKNLSDMGFTVYDDNYIVCICNNIAGGTGISVIGNGVSSLMFFNSAGENRTNATIDVAIIYLI